jgi:hypothetical protein
MQKFDENRSRLKTLIKLVEIQIRDCATFRKLVS